MGKSFLRLRQDLFRSRATEPLAYEPFAYEPFAYEPRASASGWTFGFNGGATAPSRSRLVRPFLRNVEMPRKSRIRTGLACLTRPDIIPPDPDPPTRMWRNWQTRQIQVLVGVKSLGGSTPLIRIFRSSMKRSGPLRRLRLSTPTTEHLHYHAAARFSRIGGARWSANCSNEASSRC